MLKELKEMLNRKELKLDDVQGQQEHEEAGYDMFLCYRERKVLGIGFRYTPETYSKKRSDENWKYAFTLNLHDVVKICALNKKKKQKKKIIDKFQQTPEKKINVTKQLNI